MGQGGKANGATSGGAARLVGWRAGAASGGYYSSGVDQRSSPLSFSPGHPFTLPPRHPLIRHSCHPRRAGVDCSVMRAILVGIVCFLGASAALAQATGDVESIGFDHSYRPGCWTPMVVRLTPTTGSPFEGKIAVYQDDADHNHPIFTRPISLRGNAERGGGKTQRFWMSFIRLAA